MIPRGSQETVDPILGIEHIRKEVAKVSKGAFYGPGGLYHDLPIIQLSARRKGCFRSKLYEVLAARTRQPARAA
jgi:hypothetical protein